MNIRSMADVVGTIGSVVCAMHCLVGPVLLVVGAVSSTVFLSDESFHEIMLWIVLPAGVVAFGLGCWRHKDLFTFMLGGAGLLGLTLAATVLHEPLGEWGEKLAIVAAAAALVVAHVRNFRLCRTSDCAHDCHDA